MSIVKPDLRLSPIREETDRSIPTTVRALWDGRPRVFLSKEAYFLRALIKHELENTEGK